jgi:hypothetical protein
VLFTITLIHIQQQESGDWSCGLSVVCVRALSGREDNSDVGRSFSLFIVYSPLYQVMHLASGILSKTATYIMQMANQTKFSLLLAPKLLNPTVTPREQSYNRSEKELHSHYIFPVIHGGPWNRQIHDSYVIFAELYTRYISRCTIQLLLSAANCSMAGYNVVQSSVKFLSISNKM